VEKVGSVPEQTTVGYGSRGLQRKRGCVELFPTRSCQVRAYRSGEDGLAGFSDDKQWLCFALNQVGNCSWATPLIPKNEIMKKRTDLDGRMAGQLFRHKGLTLRDVCHTNSCG